MCFDVFYQTGHFRAAIFATLILINGMWESSLHCFFLNLRKKKGKQSSKVKKAKLPHAKEGHDRVELAWRHDEAPVVSPAAMEEAGEARSGHDDMMEFGGR